MSQQPFEKRIGDRRKFFRALLNQAFEPLAESIERPLEQFQRVANPPPPPPAPIYRTLIRPPGAQSEESFLSTCMRIGRCAEVCPVKAVKFDQSDNDQMNGRPYLEVETQACALCQDVPCAYSCPTGALLPTSRESVRMGLAEWRMESCLLPMGQECRICLDKCPLGSTAIERGAEGNIEVKPEACTGCGLCQMHCPTYPKSIVVRPL